MTCFSIDTDKITNISSSFNSIERVLNTASSNVRSAGQRIYLGGYDVQIKAVINSYASQISGYGNEAKWLHEDLDNIEQLYRACEASITGNSVAAIDWNKEREKGKRDILDAMLGETIFSPFVPLREGLEKLNDKQYDEAVINLAKSVLGGAKTVLTNKPEEPKWAEALGLNNWTKDDFVKKLEKFDIGEKIFGENATAVSRIECVASWLGIAKEVLSEYKENIEEAGGKLTPRALAETIIESKTDLLLGWGAEYAIGMAAAALIPGGAPAIAVAAGAAAVVYGVNCFCKWIWKKDAGEVVSDFVCNSAEGVMEAVGYFGRKVGEKLAPAWTYA